MNNQKQKTAVDFLLDRLRSKSSWTFEDFEEAKKIEKMQIKDAFINGFCNAHDAEDQSINADEMFYRTRYGGQQTAL